MLDTEISKSENSIAQDEFLVRDEPVMKSALEILAKNLTENIQSFKLEPD